MHSVRRDFHFAVGEPEDWRWVLSSGRAEQDSQAGRERLCLVVTPRWRRGWNIRAAAVQVRSNTQDIVVYSSSPSMNRMVRRRGTSSRAQTLFPI